MFTLIRSAFLSTQRAALCALVLLVAMPTAEAAKPNPQQIEAYAQATEAERVKLLMFLAKSPDADSVTYLLKLYPLEGPYAANRQLYLEGAVLKTNRKYTAAAAKFRAALASDPKLTLVRSELAETLVILQEDDSALHQLKLLEADAPNDKAASNIRSFIDQVDSRRPYTVTGYVSVAPSSNLNNGSRHATVYSPVLGLNFATAQPKSGLGIASGISGAYTKRLGDDVMFVAAGGADGRLYDDADFNSYGLSQSLEMRYLVPQGYLGMGLVSSQQLDNQDYQPNFLSYGPRISVSLQVTPRDHLSFSVLHEWRNSLITGAEDSAALMLDGSWTHAWNSSFNTSIFSGFDRIKTPSDVTSSQTMSAGLSFYKELTFGITANFTSQISKTDFAGFNGLAGVTRADKRLNTSVALTKRDLNLFGFAPSVSYSFTDNFSNINSFDYTSHAVDFRLTKNF
jgi:outer membrane protein